MEKLSKIISTEYLWDNRADLSARYEMMNLPYREDEVEEEWREICINLSHVVYCYPITYITDSATYSVTKIFLILQDKEFIINVDYDSFCELLAVTLDKKSHTHISNISFNEQ